tara:strand:- start:26778 stop:27617 length:840 start_codon:yes stop_codon:yes gene_type:complete
MKTIDGKALAEELCDGLRDRISQFAKDQGRAPGLAVVIVGADPASHVYVAMKERKANSIGIRSFRHDLAAECSEDALLALVDQLNSDPSVDGVLVQLPLPRHVDAGRVLDRISPEKDVDGFHPVNVGRLSIGSNGLVPCTPLGVIRLLETVVTDFRGLNAVVIGKSNIVGKPIALLLLERECTVTITHIETRGLPGIVSGADIVVVAAGSPGLVRGSWVKQGAVVIDVGINRMPDGSIRGDVAFDELDTKVAAATPVPGGVGPMTIACLMLNTMEAAEM